MHQFYFNRLGLFEAAENNPSGGGGGNSDAPKLTIGQQISAALASKKELQTKISAHENTISDLNATITERDATITTLQNQLTQATGKITTLEADAKLVENALTAAQSETAALSAKDKSLDERAKQMTKEEMSSLGFPAGKLPASSSSVSDDVPATREALEAAMEKLDTQQERSALLAKFKAQGE